MAEPGSSGEPPRKRCRRGPRKVKLLFKAPHLQSFETWVYDFWLSSSEFFEAKLDRWTSTESDVEPIVLELPPQCKPEKGAHIFRKRLLAAEIKEESAWDSVRWWKSARGDEEMLLAALCVFDLVLMQQYCKEVADTLCIYWVRCPVQIGTLAKKYNENIPCLEDSSTSVDMCDPIDSVCVSSFSALMTQMHTGTHDVKPLVDRALAGCAAEDRGEFSKLLVMVGVGVYHGKEKQDMWIWLLRHFNMFLLREPEIIDGHAASFRDMQTHLDNGDVTELVREQVDEAYAVFAADTLHLLFIGSGQSGLCGAKRRALNAAIDSVVRFVASDFRTNEEDSEEMTKKLCNLTGRFKSSLSLPIFAIASKFAQRTLLFLLGRGAGKFVRDHVEWVHPDLRRMVLDYVEDLSAADRARLATASFSRTDRSDASD